MFILHVSYVGACAYMFGYLCFTSCVLACIIQYYSQLPNFWKHLSLTASVFNIFLYHMFLISSEPMCPYVPELKGVHCLFVCSQMDVGQGWGHWTGMINWPGGGINSSR